MDEAGTEALREAIRNLHGCDSTFIESIPVHEMFIVTGIATSVGGDAYRWIKEHLGGSEEKRTPTAATTTAAASTETKCTVSGKAVNQYTRQPLPQLNVVIFKPNTCDVTIMSTYTETDGRFAWRGPCSEIHRQPIYVSLGAGNYCLIHTGAFVNKDVESPFLLAVDSPMLRTPGKCQPCPTH